MSKFSFEDDFINRRKTEYAIVTYLPFNLDQVIHPFREKYDPVYNQVASHITLVFPFYTDKSLDEISSLVNSVIVGQEPINIHLESIDDFYPQSPVIYWNVKDNLSLRELYINLYAQLDIPIPHKNFIPHVTLAREISTHRVETVKDAIASYLPNESYQTSSIDLVTPLANFRWVSVRTFSFEVQI